MSEPREVWVSCDPDVQLVVITDYEPDWRPGLKCFDYKREKPFWIIGLCEFGELTGLSIKPGQCLKIKLTAEVLEGSDGNGN